VYWGGPCGEIKYSSRVLDEWYRLAEHSADIECGELGPSFEWAIFKSVRLRREAFQASRHPSDRLAEGLATCIAGRQLLLGSYLLGPGPFASLCRRLHGQLVRPVNRAVARS
jgi:hypothetical protein